MISIRRIVRRTLAVIAFCGIAVSLGFVAAWSVGLRWVITPSVPTGLWWLHQGTAHRGNYVAVCLPSNITRLASPVVLLLPGTCHDGRSPVMKRLAAMSGDIVIVSSQGVFINGVLYPKSQPLSRDAEQNAIPRMIHNGTFQLEPRTIWLMGDSPNSWDSRYYGPISRSTLLGIGTPLLMIGARSS